MIIYLDLEEVLEMHRDCISDFGGASGIRNPDAIASAVAAPASGFGDTEFYPDIFDKAAVLCFQLSESQGFVDGNKRIAILSALTLLAITGLPIKKNTDLLYNMMISIANKTATKEDLGILFKDLAQK